MLPACPGRLATVSGKFCTIYILLVCTDGWIVGLFKKKFKKRSTCGTIFVNFLYSFTDVLHYYFFHKLIGGFFTIIKFSMTRNHMPVAIMAFFLSACCKQMPEEVSVKPLEEDKTFMTAAAYSNLYIAQAGALAGSHAGDSSVRLFGKFAVDQQQTATEELQDIAASFHYQLPETTDDASSMRKQMLETVTGRQFDSLYVAYQISEYEKMEDLYEKRISQGSTGLVSRYAQKYLPLIREQHKAIQTLQ
jgi:predicted outer membrane protein